MSKSLKLRSLAAAASLALGLGAVTLYVRAEEPKAAESADYTLPAPGADGFSEIFNGKDLTGWAGIDGFWTVKDGVISGHETKEVSRQTFLVFKKPMANFELHYQYKFATPDGNSGVQFRSKVVKPEDPFRIGGYQADCDGKGGYDGGFYDEASIAGGRGIMSHRGDKTHWTAEKKPEIEKLPKSDAELKKEIKVGDWNDVVLVADGNHMTYTINGTLMTDMTDDSPQEVKEGLIGLQLHKGFTMEIQFKDIKIKVLPGSK